ncbi:hypothetical protein [Desulfobacter vibrioformis]|uniref:hypothetical protein n=1 Tax=Desulfobacter vibrioformis TaxID=34031 RepID=UPI00054DFCF7|nr:hypothetical protein [Desulfobacter vibrioformis]
MKDINVTAMETAVDIASREAEAKISEIDAIREESETTGVLKMIVHQKCHLEFIKYAELYQLKQSKSYKKGGRTWDEYCDEVVGEPRRTVDRVLTEIGPIAESFSASLVDLLGMPFNKIRMLGRAVNTESAKLSKNKLIIGDSEVLLEPDNKDEIEAVIDALIESHKTQQQDLKKKLARATKETDKIVEEATKGLAVERDALIKEVARLKPLDVADLDQSWSEAYMKEICEITQTLVVKCRKFIMDDRIDEDNELKIRVGAYMGQAELALQDLRQDWTDRFLAE